MTRKVIDFPHAPGGHCGSTAMRDLMKFHGHEITEEMAFGLGSGIGFFYLYNPAMSPPVYVGGRVAELEENFCRNLGIKMETVAGLGAEEAWLAVKERLDAGIPTMVFADVYYLDYLNARKHFSAHRIMLVGYDEERGVAFVADNDRDTIQECSLLNLEKARSSSYAPQPADHIYYKFEFPPAPVPLERAIPPALAWTVRHNLRLLPEESVIDFAGGKGANGVAGAEMLSSEMTEWPSMMSEEELTGVCRSIYVTAEKGGTGYGGNFRRIYGRFLVESEATLPGAGLSRTGEEFIAIGDLWTALSLNFKEMSSDGRAAIAQNAPIAREIALRERSSYEELERACSTLGARA